MSPVNGTFAAELVGHGSGGFVPANPSGEEETVGVSSNVVYADGWITLEEQRLRLHKELRVSALGALHYRYEYESPLSPHWYRYEYQYEYQYDYDNENPMSENEGEVEREYNAEQWSGSAWEWRSSERESNPWHRWSGWTDDETWRNSHRDDNDATNDNGWNHHARGSRQQWPNGVARSASDRSQWTRDGTGSYTCWRSHRKYNDAADDNERNRQSQWTRRQWSNGGTRVGGGRSQWTRDGHDWRCRNQGH